MLLTPFPLVIFQKVNTIYLLDYNAPSNNKMNKLQGQVEMTFVMAGLSKEKKRPFIQLSNGIEAKFLRLSKKFHVDDETFSDFEKGEVVVVEIETDGIETEVMGIDKA